MSATSPAPFIPGVFPFGLLALSMPPLHNASATFAGRTNETRDRVSSISISVRGCATLGRDQGVLPVCRSNRGKPPLGSGIRCRRTPCVSCSSSAGWWGFPRRENPSWRSPRRLRPPCPVGSHSCCRSPMLPYRGTLVQPRRRSACHRGGDKRERERDGTKRGDGGTKKNRIRTPNPSEHKQQGASVFMQRHEVFAETQT